MNYLGIENTKEESDYLADIKFNIISIAILMSMILIGWPLIFTSSQIVFISSLAIIFMKSKIQPILLLCLLYMAKTLEYHYIINLYFEYIVLGFFIIFFTYNSYRYYRFSDKIFRKSMLILLSITLILSTHVYILNSRLIKDPHLQRSIKHKYVSQFRDKVDFSLDNPRLDMINELEVKSNFSSKTLNGLEHLPNLLKLTLNNQNKIVDYSSIGKLGYLHTLNIVEPSPTLILGIFQSLIVLSIYT